MQTFKLMITDEGYEVVSCHEEDTRDYFHNLDDAIDFVQHDIKEEILHDDNANTFYLALLCHRNNDTPVADDEI